MSDRGHRQGAEAGLSEPKRSALAVTKITKVAIVTEVTIQIRNAARVSQVSQVKNHIHLREAPAFIGFRRDPPSTRLRRGKQDDATGPFCRRNRGKYATHKICSVKIRAERPCAPSSSTRQGRTALQLCSDMFAYVRICSDMFGYLEKNILEGTSNIERPTSKGARGHRRVGDRWKMADG